MPFGARLVLVAVFLFPTHVGGERQASAGGAVRCGAAFCVLAEKTNESDAIFAKHVFVFLSCPDRLGRPRSEGGRSPGQRGRFSEGQERIVWGSAKGEAGNPGGKPKPVRAGT